MGEQSTVTRRELLDIRERHWRGDVELVSLAAEALDLIDREHREQALTALGHLHMREPGVVQRERLLRRWPAVHAVATAGVAADHYASGTFWPKLTSLLGVRNEQTFRGEWGRAFLDNLEELGLPTFDGGDEDAGTKYVGRMLMHSGMPTYCLPDFFRLVADRRAKSPGLGPEEFVSWASARAAHSQLHNVDKPVVRFLQYGGDFAVDVTDRAFELLDTVSAGGDGADVPLPDRFKAVALQLRREGAIAQPAPVSTRTSTGETDQRPRFVVDPFGLGVVLRLPAVGDAPDGSAVWIVEVDGIGQRVATRPAVPGSDEPAPQTDLPIPGPARAVTVAINRREDLQTTLALIDDKDPFLAFAEDGFLLPQGLPIPGRPTWLLFPGDPAAVRVAGEITVLSESPLPPAWSGWCLLLVDLERATSVGLGDGPRHAIRGQASARVIVGEPARGVRTSAGLPVFDVIPMIQLPDALGEAKWDVTLLDGANEVISRWRSGGTNVDPNSVWEDVHRPVVGTFSVRVRGPWGRGVSRTVTLVEQVAVSYTPAWRRFDRAGLQTGEATISVAAGVDTTQSRLTYGPRDRERYVRVGAAGHYRSLVVTPPHMTVAYQSAATTTSPSVTPLRLFREDILEEPGTLILDVGEVAEPRLHVTTPTGVVQTIDPAAGRAGVYRFGLSKIVDTLAAHPQAQLSLGSAGELTVARISPRKLFSEITFGEGTLEFSDCVDVDELTASIYATRAPWRDPVTVPVRQGSAALPDHFVNAGPLRVLVRIDDPWAPLPLPTWPSAKSSILVECEGSVQSDDSEETTLSAFLAGMGPLPSTVENIGHLWTVRGLVGGLGLGSHIFEVVETIDRIVYAEPRRALLALDTSHAPTERIPRIMIRCGLVWANLADAHDEEAPTWSTRNALPSTLLCAADADWSEDEVEAAIAVCGDVVPDLLTGKDPYASDGRLDSSADIFDQLPAMREDFVKQTGLVPSGLLSGDARRLAAMEYVKLRQHVDLEHFVRNSRRLLGETERMVAMLNDPAAQAAFSARAHLSATGGWHVIPTIAFGFALAARHAARGHASAVQWVPQQARYWSDLASVVPQMVTIDLILAELLVASSAPKPQEQ